MYELLGLFRLLGSDIANILPSFNALCALCFRKTDNKHPPA
jgi:hypothetical protein